MSETRTGTGWINRKTLRMAAWGLWWWLISGVTAVLGLAPEDIITNLLGANTVNYFAKEVFDMSSETARWIFVIFSYLSFAAGATVLMGIPLHRAKKRSDSLDRQIKTFMEMLEARNAEVIEIKQAMHQLSNRIERKERTIRKLHDKTRLMLSEIRRRKENASHSGGPS